jgi:hypothetical protein
MDTQLASQEIDVYIGKPGEGDIDVILSSIDHKDIEGLELRMNTTKLRNFSAENLARNFDIISIAISVEVTDWKHPTDFEIRVDPRFWRFLEIE